MGPCKGNALELLSSVGAPLLALAHGLQNKGKHLVVLAQRVQPLDKKPALQRKGKRQK